MCALHLLWLSVGYVATEVRAGPRTGWRCGRERRRVVKGCVRARGRADVCALRRRVRRGPRSPSFPPASHSSRRPLHLPPAVAESPWLVWSPRRGLPRLGRLSARAQVMWCVVVFGFGMVSSANLVGYYPISLVLWGMAGFVFLAKAKTQHPFMIHNRDSLNTTTNNQQTFPPPEPPPPNKRPPAPSSALSSSLSRGRATLSSRRRSRRRTASAARERVVRRHSTSLPRPR